MMGLLWLTSLSQMQGWGFHIRGCEMASDASSLHVSQCAAHVCPEKSWMSLVQFRRQKHNYM